MPVTRSQKDAPLRPPSRPSDKDAAAEPSEQEGVTSVSASSGTATTTDTNTSSGTMTTEGTTTTEPTVTTPTTAASGRTGQKGLAARKMTKKTPDQAPVEVVTGLAANSKPMGVSHHARSTKTTSSSARRRELVASEELARLELKQAEAATKLARVRLDMAQCEEEDSVDEDLEERTAHVQNWIETSVLQERNQDQPEPREEPQRVKPEENSSTKGATTDMQALAAVLKEAFATREGSSAQPKYIHELPYFDGSSSEWVAFKVVYDDTAPMFCEVQNMARLRRALKGNARDAIKSLLYSEASPTEVMQALGRRFGRPDALVIAELDKIKALARISESPNEISVFASQINNSVAAIRGLKKPQYLHSPEMVKQIIEKLPTVLKFRWYDFTAASEEGEFSDLRLVSRYLNLEADKCGAFATTDDKSVYKRTHRQATHSVREKDFSERNTRQSEKRCPMCDNGHFLVECQKFRKASVEDRWATVKKSNVCFKCLQGRHRKEGCRKPPCKECHRWHHHLLHVESQKSTPKERKEITQEKTSVIASVHAVCNAKGGVRQVQFLNTCQNASSMKEDRTLGLRLNEKIENKEFEAWRIYLEKMYQLQNLQIPRCPVPHSTEGELHTFMHASKTAYAATVYWRTRSRDGTYRVKLVAAKLRVTPSKPVSIPRLELQAALLGSRLAHSVAEEMELKSKRKTFWTDSSIVLSWIKTDPRTFKTFVAHRLAEIEDLTKPQEWRWVPTAQNPADDATREVPEGFGSHHRWYTGPDFLKKEEDYWPAARSFKKETTGEEKVTNVVAVASDIQPPPNPERFSTWTRLWRTTARVLQFIQLCRHQGKVNVIRKDSTWKRVTKKKKQVAGRQQTSSKKDRRYLPLDADLRERAETLLLKGSQSRSFKEDINCLQQGKQLEGSSKLRKLDVLIENGLLRLKGRIDAIQGVKRDYKRPIVLDCRDRSARLILEEYHRRFNHGNQTTVMNEVRQRFWMLGLRSAVKAVQHQCQWCKTRRVKPQEIPTDDLPAERLMHGNPPFTCTGVDYFGPMSVTVARHHEKRWGALLTCLTTRAVHIELVSSLSTDSMIMALRRFAARRGMPKIIYSDNGTNFVGANRELQEALQDMKPEDLTTEAEKINVQWKFIPPGAPNMGGAWERLVRSIKTALGATLNERHPREEVLHTLLLEAEHIVNSRPPTHLSEDPEEEALTPNHFLLGRSCGAASIGNFEIGVLVGRDTWKATQRLADHFWQRWLREYLPTLLPRKIKGREHSTNLQVGDIVLLVDHSLPRYTWPRGRIQQVYPGPDGRTRIVDVETRGGVLRRPSSRVVLLVPGVSPSQEDGAKHEGEYVGDRRLNNVDDNSKPK